MNALAQADGSQVDATEADGARPCADPCSAQAGYASPADTQQPAPSSPASDLNRHANTQTDDDGNAPPPPDITAN
jgi:hypothetical protein